MQHQIYAEEEVYICELEQGSILGESGDEVEDKGIANDFMDPWKDEIQLRELNFETKKEDKRPYGFETDNVVCLQVM